jgi:hypothetical protein
VLAPVSIRLPGIPPAEALKAELRINAAARDCGCEVGSLFMTAALLVTLLKLWVTRGAPWPGDGGQLLRLGALVLASAIVGKLVGLARARLHLVREVERLATRIRPISAEVSHGNRM